LTDKGDQPVNEYTVNSCTKEDGRVVWSLKSGGFHNLVADILDEQDARALADKLNALPDPSVIAYMAIGANDELAKVRANERGSRLDDSLGHDGMIDLVIGFAGVVDGAFYAAGDAYCDCFYYVVAEPMGAWIVAQKADGNDWPTAEQVLAQTLELMKPGMG